MTVMVYSIEAWIMSLVGLVWLSIRTVYDNRSFLEEYLLYSQIILATLHLILVSLQIDKRDACRAYFIMNLVHWILGAYCSMDSLYPLHFQPSKKYNITLKTNTQSCCPNHDVILWNRYIYFGGFQLFLAPMAITQSLQTIHLIIAAGALSNTQHTLWPSASLGYALFGMSSFFTTVRFMGFFPGPCPEITINIFDNWISWRLETLLWFYVFAFGAAGIIESFVHTSSKTRLMWNFLTLGLVGCYTITIFWNMIPLKMITWPWLFFNGLGIVPFIYTFVEIMHPTVTEVQHAPLKTKLRNRFVLPIQTDIRFTSKTSKKTRKNYLGHICTHAKFIEDIYMFQPMQPMPAPTNTYSVFLQGKPSTDYAMTRKDKDQDWFFYMATKIASFLGLLCVVLSLIWVSTVLFLDNKNRMGYQTTTFFTSTDKTNVDSWIVQAQSWSEISKSNVAIDNKFNHYFECWYAAGIASKTCNNNTINDYKGCINNRYSASLTLCANTHNPDIISPTLNSYTQCINRELMPSRESINGLKICLRTNMWPLYESPENVDSWQFLGSYNWMTFLSIGFALFSCFVLYTGGFLMYAETLGVDKKTLVPKANGPISYGITAVCAGLALIFFAYFLVNAYRLPDNNALGSDYPLSNSVATNNVMLPATLIVFVYFILEFLELWAPYSEYKKNKRGEMKPLVQPQEAQMAGQVVYMTPNGPMLENRSAMPHNYYNPAKSPYSPDQTQWYGLMTMYYPALTLAWADAYMLDPIIALGVIGATHQVSTALVYQIFVAILTYRLAHTSVARLLYAGYIVNPDENPSKFQTKANNIVYSIRMQAMFMHLAAAVSLTMLWYIITNSNIMLSEFSLIYAMLFLWYLIPEAIRLIAHITVAFKGANLNDKYVLITCTYIVWIWDVVVRLVFITIIIWGANTISGTQNFITDRLFSISDTIQYMS